MQDICILLSVCVRARGRPASSFVSDGYKTTMMMDTGWFYEKCKHTLLRAQFSKIRGLSGNKWLKFAGECFRDTAG